eukprot:8450133-Heterocapsa_arctica.AAC.1
MLPTSPKVFRSSVPGLIVVHGAFDFVDSFTDTDSSLSNDLRLASSLLSSLIPLSRDVVGLLLALSSSNV